MADRDWDKELAKIDKQLASLSDEQLVTPPAKPAPSGRQPSAPAARAPAPAKESAKGTAEARGSKTTTTFGVYARLTLSVALGVAMVIWPYPARCGVGLAAYLAAVVVVVSSGIWSAVWAWRHRAARAHTLSLLLILWGLVLGSIEVLPRVGYAVPTALHPAAWACK